MTGFQQEFFKVALTGGLATGKTHVLDRLAKLGAPTIDADILAREAVRPGSNCLNALVERFGSDILDSTKELNRKAISRIVFDKPSARQDLEKIIHPVVYDQISRWFENIQAENKYRFGVADIPLLYETNHAKDFDRVVVIACDRETQVHRAMARDNMTEIEVKQRLSAQDTIEYKISHCDFVIWTNQPKVKTDAQIDDVYGKLVGEHRK